MNALFPHKYGRPDGEFVFAWISGITSCLALWTAGRWEKLSDSDRSGLRSYVLLGDWVSAIGQLIHAIWLTVVVAVKVGGDAAILPIIIMSFVWTET